MSTALPSVLTRPPRAYRRLPVLRPADVGLSLSLLVAIEGVLIWRLDDVVRVFGEVKAQRTVVAVGMFRGF